MKTTFFTKKLLSFLFTILATITLSFCYSQSASAATNFNPSIFTQGFGNSSNIFSQSGSTTTDQLVQGSSSSTNSQSESTTTEHNPVVFVHGLGGSSYNFISIENYLIQQGWSKDQLFAIELPDKAGNNSINGQAIDSYINDVLQKTGKSKVDIVAHSMGGSNSLYYINQLNGIEKVDKLVTLGGANKLAASTAPDGISVTSIYSSSDMVVMNSLSELEGANNIQISGVDHVGLLSNNEVDSLIVQALEN